MGNEQSSYTCDWHWGSKPSADPNTPPQFICFSNSADCGGRWNLDVHGERGNQDGNQALLLMHQHLKKRYGNKVQVGSVFEGRGKYYFINSQSGEGAMDRVHWCKKTLENMQGVRGVRMWQDRNNVRNVFALVEPEAALRNEIKVLKHNMNTAQNILVISTPFTDETLRNRAELYKARYNRPPDTFVFNPNVDIAALAFMYNWKPGQQDQKWLEIFMRVLLQAQRMRAKGFDCRVLIMANAQPRDPERLAPHEVPGNAQQGEVLAAIGFGFNVHDRSLKFCSADPDPPL